MLPQRRRMGEMRMEETKRWRMKTHSPYRCR